MTKLWFDMDGTFVDLYAVNGWLNDLIAENTRPYEIAEPLVDMVEFAKALTAVQAMGIEIGVISWTSKGGTQEFNNRVALAKIDWLNRNLPTVKWDNINIVPYGTNKFNTCGREGILFDDEERNRKDWVNGMAFLPEKIIEILRQINTQA